MQFNIWFKFDVSFPQKTLETVLLERKKVLCQQVTSYLRILFPAYKRENVNKNSNHLFLLQRERNNSVNSLLVA